MPLFSRKSFKIERLLAGWKAKVLAMFSPFSLTSKSMMSKAVRPRFKPPSSAASTLTLNQDSMDRVKKLTDTK